MSGNASAFTHKRTSPMSELPDRKALTTQVDRLLLQQGRLDPLELLLALELLPYEDYQAWRLGRRANLLDALLAETRGRCGVAARSCRSTCRSTPRCASSRKIAPALSACWSGPERSMAARYLSSMLLARLLESLRVEQTPRLRYPQLSGPCGLAGRL
jgi:hypothetical protein